MREINTNRYWRVMKKMIVSKNSKKLKCDISGCNMIADYVIEYKKGFRANGLYVCKDCMKNMYESMGKFIVPKSPVNILNLDKKKEKRNEKK